MSLNLSEQVSFKVKQKHRPAQKNPTKGSSRKDRTVNHLEQAENNLTTDDASEVASKEYQDPNSTNNATEHHRGTSCFNKWTAMYHRNKITIYFLSHFSIYIHHNEASMHPCTNLTQCETRAAFCFHVVQNNHER